MISRKALVALDCSSSSSCCSRALGSTSAPPDRDAVFATLKHWGFSTLGDLLSCGRGSQGTRLSPVVSGKGRWGAPGNVGQVRRAGSPRHSTGTQGQPERDTRTFSWTLFPIRPTAHRFPTQQTQCSKQPCLGTAKFWVFSINPWKLHGHHSPISHIGSPPPSN